MRRSEVVQTGMAASDPNFSRGRGRLTAGGKRRTYIGSS